MKKVLSITILISFSLICFGQNKIFVKEKTASIGGGSNNAFVVNIYEGNEKIIEKEWKSFMKGYKAKVASKKEIFADDALIPSISDNAIDVYAKVEKAGDFYKLTVGFNLGGAYLSSGKHGASAKTAEKMIYDFAVKTSKVAVDEEIKDAEKALKKMESELKNLQNNKEKLEDNIESYKMKIEQAEKDIEKNISDQGDMEKNIATQQETLKAIETKKDAIK